MSPAGGSSLSARTLKGMFWAYGSYVGGRALVLVSIAILARLLTPGDFGLVALALAFIAFFETLRDLGVTQALILTDEEEVEARAETAWVASLVIGLVLSVGVAALGPVAAAYFDEPQMVAVLPALGLNFLLRAIGATHYALAQKRLDFRTRTAAEFADVLCRGTVGIGLALAGAGVWSLIVGYLVGTLAMNVALWRLVPWRPSYRPRREHLHQLLSFGGALTGLNFVAAIINAADDLIVASALGTVALGFYGLAYRIPRLLIINLSLVAGQVLFPAMASLSAAARPAAFVRSLRYALMVGLPLTAGLAVFAEPMVVAVFGEKWRGAGPAMQVMALWTLMSPISVVIGTAYKSMGRADLLLKLAIPQALLLVGAIVIFVDLGIVAVAACQAVLAFVSALIGMVIATRMLDATARSLWGAIWPPAVAAIGLTAVLVPFERAVESPWPAIVGGAAIGALVYPALLWLVARDTLRELIATARLGRTAPGPGV